MTRLSCDCGATTLDVDGPPILAAECHCTSCRTAGHQLEALGCPPVLAPNGGTHFVVHRKDRIFLASGGDELAAFRLSPDATTRRVIACCCRTPMYLEFSGGHWLSLYAALWPVEPPPPELRTMTRDVPAGTTLRDDIPNARTHTVSFMGRLLWAWVRMGFRNPAVADVTRTFPN